MIAENSEEAKANKDVLESFLRLEQWIPRKLKISFCISSQFK